MRGRRTEIEKGERFGRLVILVELPQEGYKRYFLCKCDCGNYKNILLKNLIKKTTLSCGCLSRDKHTTHGFSKSRLYPTWKLMLRRCQDETYRDFHLYGERGISVCQEWRDFSQFNKWSLNNGWKEGLQLDRINNNDGYFPLNCRWTTSKVQANNTRRNLKVTYKETEYNLAQLCDKLNISHKYNTIYYRLNTMGLSIDEAILNLKHN